MPRCAGLLVAITQVLDILHVLRSNVAERSHWTVGVSLEVSGLESQAEIPRIRDEDPKLFEISQLNPVR